MNRANRWFWSIVVAQAVFLLAWAGWHEQVRAHAPVVRLKTRLVDPRDLLRGDFMILRYEISEIRPPAPVDGMAAAGAREFWVVLEPRDGFYHAVSASWARPTPSAGQIAVLGRPGARGDVVYGIESYFVPEGKGTPRFKSLEVEAAVSPSHRLYIKRLLLDGRPYP